MDKTEKGYWQLANDKRYQKIPFPVYPRVSLSTNMILNYLNEQKFTTLDVESLYANTDNQDGMKVFENKW